MVDVGWVVYEAVCILRTGECESMAAMTKRDERVLGSN